ncbi:MAG: hypothetical protein MUF49_11275 [Oculatellaceae cyanobacterium Prado106]|jgi:hypothetical protein|nr:hypothetical protein [Oculatellaceae cyanobacterium Prado106]
MVEIREVGSGDRTPFPQFLPSLKRLKIQLESKPTTQRSPYPPTSPSPISCLSIAKLRFNPFSSTKQTLDFPGD